MINHLTLAIIAVFASVAIATGVLASRVLAIRSPERRRFRKMFQPIAETDEAAISLLADPPESRGLRRLSRWIPQWPSRIGNVVPRLEALGYRGASAVVMFSAIEFALGVGLGLATLALLGPAFWLTAVLMAAVGFVLPHFALGRRFSRRQKAIQNGLPDALDLCVICLEAGCTLDHAIDKTSNELALAHPELASELNLLRAETRAGKA